MSGKPTRKPAPKGEQREAEPINDTMEGVAKAIFAVPPKKNWRYLSKR